MYDGESFSNKFAPKKEYPKISDFLDRFILVITFNSQNFLELSKTAFIIYVDNNLIFFG